MSLRDELHDEINELMDEEAAEVVVLLEGMTNNEKFNVMLNSCKNPRKAFDALAAIREE